MKNKLLKYIFDEGFLFILLFILAILPLVLLSFYNYPSSDDYPYANNTIEKGFINAQVFWYATWTGRYFSTAVLSLNPLVYHAAWLFKLTPVILILALYFTVYTFVNLFYPGFNKIAKHAITSILVVLYFIQMPDVSEGIFWFAGSYTYQSSDILVLACACCVIYYLKTFKTGWLVIAGILIAFIIGCNETTMLYADIVLLLLTVIYFITKKRGNYALLGLLFIAVLFSVIVIKSPGNAIRSSYFKYNHWITGSVISSIKCEVSWVKKWYIYIFLMLLLLYDFIGVQWQKNTMAVAGKNYLWLSGMVWIVIPFIGFFPSFWSMSLPPPARTMDTIYFFTLLGGFIFIYFLIGLTKGNYPLPAVLKIACWVLLIGITLFKTNTISNAYSDLWSGRAANYRTQMKKREIALRNCADDTCWVTPITNVPLTLYFDDIKKDETDWRTQGLCIYYHKKHILFSAPDR